MVNITKETTVTGSPDQSGEVPMIDGGNWPFFVNAPGTAVSIRGLHFVRPKAGAIWICCLGAVDYGLPDRRPAGHRAARHVCRSDQRRLGRDYRRLRPSPSQHCQLRTTRKLQRDTDTRK